MKCVRHAERKKEGGTIEAVYAVHGIRKHGISALFCDGSGIAENT